MAWQSQQFIILFYTMSSILYIFERVKPLLKPKRRLGGVSGVSLEFQVGERGTGRRANARRGLLMGDR